MFRWDARTSRWRWAALGAAALAACGASAGAHGAERMVLGEYFTKIG